ncbi:MAG: hypothetical protein QM722_16915 [Piscinibacter sp.]
MHRITNCSALLIAMSLAACGGGGGGGGTDATSPELPSHQMPTLALTASDAAHVAARVTASVALLDWIGRTLASDLENVTPAKPAHDSACGSGSWSIRYQDVDRDNAISVGDTISMAAPDCGVPAYAQGTAVATVLAAKEGALADVRVDLFGGRPPPLAGWNWVPTVSGQLRLTAHESGFWLRADAGLDFDIDAQEWLRVSRIGLRLGDAPFDPPTQGVEGGFDLTLHDPVLGEGRIQLDTAGGRTTAGAPSVAPSPGYYVLRGTGNTRMTIADAGPPQRSWFRVRTDSTGTGVYDGEQIISFLDILDPL